MTVISKDFALHRYGLDVRLVKESDAAFILSLRTDPLKCRYIGYTSSNIQDQIEWIKRYKIRESSGTDFYFIYYYEGKPVGVNRIYGITDNTFIHGSWLFSNDAPPYCAIAAAVIARQIAFYNLDLKEEIDTAGIHVDNVSVWQFAKFMGEEFTGTRIDIMGEFKTGRLSKENFEKNFSKIIRLFPKKKQYEN